jgi:hypothetical protein
MAFNIETSEPVVKRLSAEGIVFTVTYTKAQSPNLVLNYRSNYGHTEAEVSGGGSECKSKYAISLNGSKIIEKEFDPEKILLKDLLYTVAECAGDLDQSIEDFNEDIERLTD